MNKLKEAFKQGFEKEANEDRETLMDRYDLPEGTEYLGFTEGYIPGAHYFKMPNGEAKLLTASISGQIDGLKPADDVPDDLVIKDKYKYV